MPQATTTRAREELLQFLDEQVFDPVLKARLSSDASPSDERKLNDVKRRTESEKRRYHDDYRSADEIRGQYLSDLRSGSAESVNRELDRLGLPRLPEVKGDFLALCERLGVGPRGEAR